MMKYMKGIAVTAPGKVEPVDDIPMPVPGDYEALVKVHACGFCNGTDMQIINGTGGDLGNEVSIYPTVLGHEGAGEIVAVGKKVRHIHIGERWIHPNLHTEVGNGYHKTHGSMAQYGLVSDNQAMLEDGFTEKDFPWVKQHKFPDSIDYVDAGVLLSLAECHSAAKNFGVDTEKDVLIYGAGPMGIALGMFCTLRGANVTQIDSIQERLLQAKTIGKAAQIINFAQQNVDAVLNGKKFDIVIDAVGSTKILYEGSSRLKSGGRLCSLGVLKQNDLVIDSSRLQVNTSLHMLNFPVGEYAIMDETIRMIEDGRVNPKDFYSHVLPFEKIHDCMDLIKDKKALKVILTID